MTDASCNDFPLRSLYRPTIRSISARRWFDWCRAPSTIEYAPSYYARCDAQKATKEIGGWRIVGHEEATGDIAADCGGSRHRAIDRGHLSMIGGPAFRLEQGADSDIVDAVRATAQDEGDGNDCQPDRRKADPQHGRAHDSGRAERRQSDPMANNPFGQPSADQHPNRP